MLPSLPEQDPAVRNLADSVIFSNRSSHNASGQWQTCGKSSLRGQKEFQFKSFIHVHYKQIFNLKYANEDRKGDQTKAVASVASHNPL